MALGVSQQILLVPVFLHFWTSDMLAAWLVIYAAGNLVLVADAGLQFRAINRFLAFRSSVDCDGRTGQFYAAMLRVYLGLIALFGAVVPLGVHFLPPSSVLGFQATSQFDSAFLVMVLGILFLALPANLASGLYRARGNYGRVVWLQSGAMLAGQFAQLLAITVAGTLLAVTIAYVSASLVMLVYLLAIDAPRLFPFLRARREPQSWRWSIGQLRLAFPFAVAGATEIALLNAPVLLVSALVSDRIAVAQWGLTRVVAGLLRALCIQTALPLAAELGHEHAIGRKEQLRSLYARGSMLLALLASLVVSGLLPFWSDFFGLWTHGAVPYDRSLTIVLLIGTGVAAPSILALSFANYSDRGVLLVRTKGLQLVVFLGLAVALIPPLGPMGAAIAIVASDLLVQFGLLGLIVIGQTLRHPFRHIAVLAMVAVVVVLSGWGLGTAIRWLTPWKGGLHLVAECAFWLIAVTLIASPLASKSLRERLAAAIPC